MKILLTGSNGFIGSYFRKKYATKYAIESFSFLKDHLEAQSFDSIDAVVHLSALVHQMGGASWEAYNEINIKQTLALASKAKAEGVKHFVFMSSIKVYGEETKTAYSEQSVCQPKDDYGRSKLEAEKQLRLLEDVSFTVTVLRTPIVYGKGVKANILNLTKLIKRLPILPFGSINNHRSMVYIGNLAALLERIIDQKASGIFLAADDEALSTTRLIKLIAKALPKKVLLIRIPLFATFLRVVKPSFYQRLFESLEVDNRSTKETLKFKNPYSTTDGIKYMINGEQ